MRASAQGDADTSARGVGANKGVSRKQSQVGFLTITEIDEDNLVQITDYSVPAGIQQPAGPEVQQEQTTKRASFFSYLMSGRHSSSAQNAGDSPYPSQASDSSDVNVMSAMRKFTWRFSSIGSNHPSELSSVANHQSREVSANVGDISMPPAQHRRGRTTIMCRGPDSSTETGRLDDDSTGGAGATPEGDLKKLHFSLRNVIDHPAWLLLTFFCTFVLLFGSQIQDLWLPKSGDKAVDVIFTLAFITFSIDIIVRSIVDPIYFSCSLRKPNRFDQASVSDGFWTLGCNACSFFFWCDVIATLSLLYDISYINAAKQRPLTFVITLKDGFPVSGLRTMGINSPVAFQWELIITVGRAARIARFIRTSVVVELTTRINCLQFRWGKTQKTIRHVAQIESSTLTENKGSNNLIKMKSLTKFLSRNRIEKCQHDDSHKSAVTSRSLAESANTNTIQRDSHQRLSMSGGRSSRFVSSSILSSAKSSVPLQTFGEEEEEDTTQIDTLRTTPMKDFELASSKNTSRRETFKNNLKNIAVTIGIPSSNVSRGECGENFPDNSAEPVKKPKNALFSNNSKESSSHVGAAMRELTGQRVATGIMVALLISVICTYREADGTNSMAMIMLHGQTGNPNRFFVGLALNTARSSVIPTLYNYTRANQSDVIFSEIYGLSDSQSVENLREREIMSVNVQSYLPDIYTNGLFDNREAVHDSAKAEIVTTIFIICIWITAVTSFAGPVMTLIIRPIERMIRLLSMLMHDPLDYESTKQYQRFVQEDDDIANESMWTKEVLKGMETNFLMSTILRIGSLMKVGFGTAGVEIIRNNLEKGRRKDVLFLNKQGSTVSCIFLFCDIRQFTDATECLQEDVFVFTNKIAAVVHSICHSYGGSANKNIGDAFLLSWLLDDIPTGMEDDDKSHLSGYEVNNGTSECLHANNNQADKALLSVVKICIALHFDNYFVKDMNQEAHKRLMSKLSKRTGPVVQMGFGLHAGKAVQGAIGSQRKLDATYISESVERAEFLESNTKKYGIPLLMSDAFYNLLEPANRYRCRKVDQLIILSEEDADLSDPREIIENGEKMDIYTFDMDIEALWKPAGNNDDDISVETVRRRSRTSSSSLKREAGRRSSSSRRGFNSFKAVDIKDIQSSLEESGERFANRKLVLPTEIYKYSDRSWLEPEIKQIRRLYVSNGIFFPKFDDGLKSYYSRDWDHAKHCFELILSQIEDGPSKYFLKCIEEQKTPPKNFIPYSMP